MSAAAAVIVISPEELSRIVEAAVRRALDARIEGSPADWMDTREAAALIKVHPRSITRLVRDEALPCVKLGPQTFRFERAAVLRWLASR